MKLSMLVWWNDSLIEQTDVSIPVTDRTYLLGQGVFETIRAVDGVPLFWLDHYSRLKSSASALFLEVPDGEVLRGRIEKLLEANDLAAARVRLTLGENCLITAEALEPEVIGVTVKLRENAPINERSPLAGIKCASYAENMALLYEAGSSEVLRPNTLGELCEGCVSNVFFVKDGRVFTPSLATGCLSGVMRQQVMNQIEVEEGRWPFEMIVEVDEIWLTNSIRRLRYANQLEAKVMPEPSELFHKLRSQIP